LPNLIMPRASPSASRRNRCTIHPNDDSEVVSNDALKHYQCALHEQPPPRTISTDENSSNYDDDVPSANNNNNAEQNNHNATHCHDFHLCPVTGLLTNVLDDYIVLPEILGEGHYGCVRECIHRTTRQKNFACKSIIKSKISRLDHLQNEILLLSEMNHRGIMKMVDCYEDVDYVHIVTEKIGGGELFDEILNRTTDRGCLSEGRAARIVKSLLEAVAYLHANEIVHRDIKPENILFESPKEDDDEKACVNVKLIDFGLSRRHERWKEGPMTNSVGTAYYMAPELLEGKYDKSCDIWSVGTVVYILSCGYPPFNGETDPDIFENIKRGQFEFPARQWSARSDEAKDFIKCLLRRDPRKRFTASEAMCHPWIKNLGRRQAFRKVQRKQVQPALRHLRIP